MAGMADWFGWLAGMEGGAWGGRGKGWLAGWLVGCECVESRKPNTGSVETVSGTGTEQNRVATNAARNDEEKKKKSASKCTISVLEHGVQKVGLGSDGYPCAIILFFGGYQFPPEVGSLAVALLRCIYSGVVSGQHCNVYASALS